jgi:transcriptional regulator with XRE-family HTH domain
VFIEIMQAEHLNNYIRTHRRRACFSQEELAFLMGSGSGTKISRYERERRDPTLETALTLEAIFGVPVRELFAGKFHKVERSVADRARQLIAQLRSKSPSAATTAKLQVLTTICSKFFAD